MWMSEHKTREYLDRARLAVSQRTLHTNLDTVLKLSAILSNENRSVAHEDIMARLSGYKVDLPCCAHSRLPPTGPAYIQLRAQLKMVLPNVVITQYGHYVSWLRSLPLFLGAWFPSCFQSFSYAKLRVPLLSLHILNTHIC